jgi:DNA repair exonuclease SbcCD ATPase subunit
MKQKASFTELKASLMKQKASFTELKASLMKQKASFTELKASLMELKASLETFNYQNTAIVRADMRSHICLTKNFSPPSPH